MPNHLPHLNPNNPEHAALIAALEKLIQQHHDAQPTHDAPVEQAINNLAETVKKTLGEASAAAHGATGTPLESAFQDKLKEAQGSAEAGTFAMLPPGQHPTPPKPPLEEALQEKTQAAQAALGGGPPPPPDPPAKPKRYRMLPVGENPAIEQRQLAADIAEPEVTPPRYRVRAPGAPNPNAGGPAHNFNEKVIQAQQNIQSYGMVMPPGSTPPVQPNPHGGLPPALYGQILPPQGPPGRGLQPGGNYAPQGVGGTNLAGVVNNLIAPSINQVTTGMQQFIQQPRQLVQQGNQQGGVAGNAKATLGGISAGFQNKSDLGSVGDFAGAAGNALGMIPGIGPVFQALGGFAKALVDGVEKLREWGHSLHKTNMQFAEFSAAMSEVAANQRMREIELSSQRGDTRAESAEHLAAGMNNLDRALAPIEDLMGNFKNEVAGDILGNLGDLVEQFNELLRMLGMAIKTREERDKEMETKSAAQTSLREFSKASRWVQSHARPARFDTDTDHSGVGGDF